MWRPKIKGRFEGGRCEERQMKWQVKIKGENDFFGQRWKLDHIDRGCVLEQWNILDSGVDLLWWGMTTTKEWWQLGPRIRNQKRSAFSKTLPHLFGQEMMDGTRIKSLATVAVTLLASFGSACVLILATSIQHYLHSLHNDCGTISDTALRLMQCTPAIQPVHP